jgi:hypothetical protein
MNRQVHTIFCDDIRHEIGGKISFIGAYSGAMLVSQFPAVLPKLCLALSIVTPATQPFKKLSFRILKDDEKLAEGELSEQEFANFAEADGGKTEIDLKDRVQTFCSIFVFSPFKLDAPCVLRVRVDTEAEELRGIGLRIEQAPAHLAQQAALLP